MKIDSYIKIFNQLGFLILFYQNQLYYIKGQPPAWYKELYGLSVESFSEELLLKKFPVLSTFLPTIINKFDHKSIRESNIWEMDDSQGGKFYFSCLAVHNVDENTCLLIQKKNDTFQNTQGILQKAREINLQFDQLQDKYKKNQSDLHSISLDFKGYLDSISNTTTELRATINDVKQLGQLKSLQRQINHMTALQDELLKLI